MHIVSFDKQMYSDMATASSKPGGLAVVGVLFKMHASGSTLPRFGDLLNAIAGVRDVGNEVEIGAFRPDRLLHGHTSHFFRYRGSLTTPPCTENVIWTVLKKKLSVSKEQVGLLFDSLILSKDGTVYGPQILTA